MLKKQKNVKNMLFVLQNQVNKSVTFQNSQADKVNSNSFGLTKKSKICSQLKQVVKSCGKIWLKNVSKL